LVSRSCSYKKRKKKNIKNVLKETHLPKPKVYLPFKPIPRSEGVQEAIPTKKKEKKTLETFLEKPTAQTQSSLTISAHSKVQRGPRSHSYKKERKENVRNILRETLPKPNIHLPIPISKDPIRYELFQNPWWDYSRSFGIWQSPSLQGTYFP